MRSLLSLVLLASLAAAAAAQDRPTVHVPTGLAADAVVPVLVVEGGVVERSGLPETAFAAGPCIVVETASVRGVLTDPDVGIKVEDAVEAALTAAQGVRDIQRCPWVLVGFSAAAVHFAQLEWRAAGRFQGLVLANAPMTRAQLVHAVLGLGGHPTLVLNGARDPVAPQATGRALAALLGQTGLAVTARVLDTDDHLAPFGAEGMAAIAAWCAPLTTTAVTARPAAPARVTTQGADDIPLTADCYDTGDRTGPILCCFHQARSSRAEYRPIAVRLQAAGYNVLAVDQRSGDTWNGVANATAAAAAAAGAVSPDPGQALAGYLAARADLTRAVAWARELGFTGPLGLIGSSYSSSLVIFVGADTPDVAAVVSCSPGNYLPPADSILAAGRRLDRPVLIVCPPNEERQARVVFDAVASEAKQLFVQPDGRHGASTLYTSPTAETAWTALLGFLESHLGRRAPTPAGRGDAR